MHEESVNLNNSGGCLSFDLQRFTHTCRRSQEPWTHLKLVPSSFPAWKSFVKASIASDVTVSASD
jgi:hypothetical protein